MARDTESGLPDSHIAGDYLKWSDAAPTGSPDDVWFHFRSESGRATFKAQGTVNPSDSTQYLFTLTPKDTADVPPGRYLARMLSQEDGKRTTEDKGALILLENPESPEPESHEEKCLRLLEAHIEGRLPRGLESFSIEGRSINKLPIAEAVRLRDIYASRVDQQNRARKARETGNSGNRIVYQFN